MDCRSLEFPPPLFGRLYRGRPRCLYPLRTAAPNRAADLTRRGRLSETQPAREVPLERASFARFLPKTTRWRDNDAYGHLNNVVYYELFDSAVNAILIEAGLLDVEKSPVIGLVAETSCRYFASLRYPDLVEVGVAVEGLGRSSVRYRLGVFRAGAPTAAAQGRFTHVYVDRVTGKPAPIPDAYRRLMESLKIQA
jgi:acyl-CoA thioester hydrolase